MAVVPASDRLGTTTVRRAFTLQLYGVPPRESVWGMWCPTCKEFLCTNNGERLVWLNEKTSAIACKSSICFGQSGCVHTPIEPKLYLRVKP